MSQILHVLRVVGACATPALIALRYANAQRRHSDGLGWKGPGA